MPFRFRKTMKVAPGLRLNVGKRGLSTTIGGKGRTTNISSRGVNQTFGLPGSGVSYTTKKKKGCGSAAILVLLLIFMTAFAWPAPAIAASTTAVAKPFKIVKLTSPVKRGAKAKLIIQTVPKATCNLTYRTPSGRASTAKGLGKKIADAKGKCKWTWLISSSTNPGTGWLTITANGETQRKPIIIK